MAAALFLSACGTDGPDGEQTDWIPAKANILEQQVASALQMERRIARIEPSLLEVTQAHLKAARGHSEDMAATGFFDHVSPNGDSPSDRFKKSRPFFYGRIGENIWSRDLTPGAQPNLAVIARDCVAAWMDSAPHRALILDPAMTHMGIGAIIADNKVLVTLVMTGAGG